MIELDTEVVRHIFAENYPALRSMNVTTELFSLDTEDEDEQDVLIRTKSLLNFVEDYWRNFDKTPPASVVFEEFPWTEEDYFSVEPETEPGYLSERLRKRYVKHLQRKQVWELATASPEEFAEVYVTGSRKVFQAMSTGENVVTGGQAFDVIEWQRKRVEEGKTLGESLGFPEIDAWTGGIRPGHLAILAALPKRMKTWNEIAAWVSQARAGKRPYFSNLELSNEELVGRILCFLAGDISYTRYYRGELLPHEWKRIGQAAEEFKSFDGAVVSKLPPGNRFVSSILLEAEKYDSTCIIVDQFSYLQPVTEFRDEHRGYKEVIYDIKNACMNFDLCWYMAAQLGRQSVGDDDFPIAQHLGLTRAVEEVSDLIMGIRTNDALKEERQIEFGVIESRHCESGPKARWIIEHDLYTKTKFEIRDV